jgi:hypothetical protein
MRKLLITAFAFVALAQAQIMMQPFVNLFPNLQPTALIGSANGGTSCTTSCSITIPALPAGSYIVLHGRLKNGATNSAKITIADLGTTNVTWTSLIQQNVSTTNDDEFVGGLVSGGASGTTITITPTATTTVIVVVAEYFSGTALSSVVDGGTSTTPTAGTYSTTGVNDIVVAGFCDQQAGVSTQPSAPWVGLTAVTASGVACKDYYYYPGTVGAQSMSLTISASQLWGTGILGLKRL